MTLADDVVAELERLRREEGLGLSEALNRLARRGIASREAALGGYRHRSARLGMKVDVTNIADVLESLDERG